MVICLSIKGKLSFQDWRILRGEKVQLDVVSKYQIRFKDKASSRSVVALRRASGYGGTSRESAAYMGM
jgi:hypothetical protein